MTHQIVCIGDVHKRSGHFRDAAYVAALDSIIDYGLSLPSLALWLQAGDLFDQRSSVDDRNAIAERFQRMAARAPIVCVEGNHGVPGDSLIFSRLAAAWPIYVVVSPRTLRVPLPTGATAIVGCLPYPARSGLIAAGASAADTQQAGGAALGDILQGLAAEIEDGVMRCGDLPLFLGHINVAGATLSNFQPSIGREIEISRETLQLLGPFPKILGHVHKPQQFDSAQAWYCGSVAPCNFGELEEKRFLLVEYFDDRARLPPSVTSVPIQTPALYHVEGEFTREYGFTWRATRGPGGEMEGAPSTWDGCEVRVRFRFPASERSIVAEDVVRAQFAGAARLELEPVAIPDRGLRSEEVAAAKTLAEKIDAWSRANGGSNVAATVLQKLADLEHRDGPDVLSAVATLVANMESGQKHEVAA
jgi:hypothetical protein